MLGGCGIIPLCYQCFSAIRSQRLASPVRWREQKKKVSQKKKIARAISKCQQAKILTRMQSHFPIKRHYLYLFFFFFFKPNPVNFKCEYLSLVKHALNSAKLLKGG